MDRLVLALALGSLTTAACSDPAGRSPIATESNALVDKDDGGSAVEESDGGKSAPSPTPPSPSCTDAPIPTDVCGDPSALKDYVAQLCGSDVASLELPDGDPCGAKSTVECCASPLPSCTVTPIPVDVCGDPSALKDYVAQLCGGDVASLELPDGDPCGAKSAIECCAPASSNPCDPSDPKCNPSDPKK